MFPWVNQWSEVLKENFSRSLEQCLKCLPNSEPTLHDNRIPMNHWSNAISYNQQWKNTYCEGEFAFGGVCLSEQRRQLKYCDLALLTTDGKVLATAVWRCQCTHADTPQHVWCYQLTYCLTLVAAVIHPDILKRTLLWAECGHLTTPHTHHNVVSSTTTIWNFD